MIALEGSMHKGCPCRLAAALKGQSIEFVLGKGIKCPETGACGPKDCFKVVCEKLGYADAKSELVDQAFEFMHSDLASPLFKQHKTIVSLLGMGIRRSHIQTDLYAAVLEFEKERFAPLETLLSTQKYFNGETLGASDIAYFSALSHVYMLCMVEENQALYPHLSAWYTSIYYLPEAQALYASNASVFILRHNVEIDLEPKPEVVAKLADASVALNAGAVKAASQRDLEKAKKTTEETPKSEVVEETSKPVEVVAEDPAKVYTPEECMETLNTMNIQYKRLDHPAAHTVEDVLKYVDMSESVPTKNLFLKAKKPHENESGLYLVIASVNTTVDIKKLTSDLKYKSGSLRFADDATLEKYMHVKQGHLSLLSLLNEHSKTVKVILDNALMKNDFHKISLHPLTNEISLVMSVDDAMKFLKSRGNNYEERDF
ncbi:hypothetical protein WA158_005517 [Blastocystis sp. Blastoise]